MDTPTDATSQLMDAVQTYFDALYYTLALHKIAAQNRFAASIAASKGQYSFFLDLT